MKAVSGYNSTTSLRLLTQNLAVSAIAALGFLLVDYACILTPFPRKTLRATAANSSLSRITYEWVFNLIVYFVG